MLQRLDKEMVERKLVQSRSQAENLIKLGHVKVNGNVTTKASMFVGETHKIFVETGVNYVSRAALKLKSATEKLGIDFRGKTMLDVGSSTGGFTDFALRKGATKVIAVDVGTDQLHPSLLGDERIELHEKTDIRDIKELSTSVDIVVIDVSFISLKMILPAVYGLVGFETQIIAMVKPQFESGNNLKTKGVIKNDTIRRDILKNFEQWAKQHFVLQAKADSDVAGAKGNRERFYVLKKAR